MTAFSELHSREFYEKTVRLMAPFILQQLLTFGINLLDNLMMASFGEVPIAAVSLSTQYYAIFQFVSVGVGSGAIVMSSQFWGKRRQDLMKKVAAMALRFSLAISLAFCLITVLFTGDILRLYSGDTAVIEAGIPYLRIVGITLVFAGTSSCAAYLLRSSGHIRIPFIASSAAFVLNIFFNWIFIFGKLGAPELGVTGAALGTLIARVFECLVVLTYFVTKDGNFNFRIKDVFLQGGDLRRDYFRYSIPVLISDTLVGVGLSVGASILGHVGSELVAANAIVHNGNQVLMIANTSMSNAAGVVIGNTIGEEDVEKAYRQGLAYIILSLIMGTLFSLIIIVIAKPYLGLYDVSPETMETAKGLVLFMVIMSPLQNLSFMASRGIIRGGGDTKFLMIVDTAVLWGMSLPLGALAGFVWHLPAFWILFFVKVEFGAKAVIFLIRFFTKKWIRVIQT